MPDTTSRCSTTGCAASGRREIRRRRPARLVFGAGRNSGAQHIFHLAAVSDVNYAFRYPVYSTALNVMGTTNVLEAARINGAERVHLASTVWVYNGAPEGDAIDERTPFHLDGAGHLYTSTKMACEMLCHNYRELYDLHFTVHRYGIPYGPRMREELLIPIFLKRALKERLSQSRGGAISIASRVRARSRRRPSARHGRPRGGSDLQPGGKPKSHGARGGREHSRPGWRRGPDRVRAGPTRRFRRQGHLQRKGRAGTQLEAHCGFRGRTRRNVRWFREQWGGTG